MPPLPTGAVSVAALLPVVALVSVIPGFAQYPSELTIRSTTTLIQVSLTAQDLYLLDSAGLELICDFGTDRDVLMQRAAALTGRLPFERGLGGRYAQIGQGSAIGQVQLAPGAKTATIVAVQRAYRVLAHGRRSECAGENCGSSRARATQEGVDLGVVRHSRRDRNQ